MIHVLYLQINTSQYLSQLWDLKFKELLERVQEGCEGDEDAGASL